MEQKVAVLALIGAALIWSISNISYKIIIELGVPFLLVVWVAFVFRFISVWIISDYKKVKHEIITDFWGLKTILLNALFSLGYTLFFLLAILNTDFSNAYFIVYTVPAWVLVFAVIFLGEKLNIKKFAGIALTLLGVYLIANPTNFAALDLGVLFAFATAFCYAGDVITGRELKDYSCHTVSIYSTGFRLICLTIPLIFTFRLPEMENLFLLLGLVALIGFFRGIASDFYFYALEKIEASTASVITLTELIFASVLAFFIFGETHSIIELIGYGLVLVSGFIILFRKSDLEHFEHLLHIHRRH